MSTDSCLVPPTIAARLREQFAALPLQYRRPGDAVSFELALIEFLERHAADPKASVVVKRDEADAAALAAGGLPSDVVLIAIDGDGQPVVVAAGT